MALRGYSVGGYYADEVCVRCPRCSGYAVLDYPWNSYSVLKVAPPSDTTTDWSHKGYTYIETGDKGGRWVLLEENTPDLEGLSYYLSGYNSLVVEKYPYLMHKDVFNSEHLGNAKGYVVKCYECHLVDAHVVKWPGDAYFQWDIRGQTLWAFSRKHAAALLEFIRSNERDETQFGHYSHNLRKLPTHFIAANMRDLIVKEISATLKMERTPATVRAKK
jgi:hypothetical protein